MGDQRPYSALVLGVRCWSSPNTGTVASIAGLLAVPTLIVAVVIGYVPLFVIVRRAKSKAIEALCEPFGVTYRLSPKSAPALKMFRSLNLADPSKLAGFMDLLQRPARCGRLRVLSRDTTAPGRDGI